MYGEDPYPGGGLLGAMLRARNLYGIIQSAQQQKQAHQLQLLEYQRKLANDQAEQQRQARLDATNADAKAGEQRNRDFDNSRAAINDGAQRITDVGQLWFSKNQGEILPGAPKTATSSGELLRYPSVEQKSARAADAAAKKTTAEVQAKAAAEPKYKLLPEVAKFLGKDEATKGEIESYVSQHNASNPNLHLVTNTDDQGNVSVTAINPRTFERVGTLPLGQVGKSKSEARALPAQVSGKVIEFEKERKKAMSLYNRVSIFEQDAKNKEDAGNTEKAQESRAKAEGARRQADEQLKFATTMATTLAQAYPDQIEGGPGEGGWPYVKMKPGKPSGASPKQASGAIKFAGKVPASKLAALAKGRGVTVNQFRKELASQNVEIDEKN